MKITLLTGKTFDIAEELGFEIKVCPSLRAKRLSLRIDTKNRCPVLSLPRTCSRRRAIDFVLAHKDWINEGLSKIPAFRPLGEQEYLTIDDKTLQIKHCPELHCGVRIDGDCLLVTGNKSFMSRRIRDFIKELAHRRLTEMSVCKATQLGYTINRIVIKDTKSRWGSCSSLNNINYNWRIMLAPHKVIDYLVAHEVAHLKHHNHSTDFWKTVDLLAEDADSGRKWLKDNGNLLNLYI